jgi:hypothetical protein
VLWSILGLQQSLGRNIEPNRHNIQTARNGLQVFTIWAHMSKIELVKGRLRRKAPKVRTGCNTCRVCHVKCDETKPEVRGTGSLHPIYLLLLLVRSHSRPSKPTYGQRRPPCLAASFIAPASCRPKVRR